MKRKIIGIFIGTLLIATAVFPVVGVMNRSFIDRNNKIHPCPQDGVDQEQVSQCGRGYNIVPSQWLAQGFKPSVEKLTAVQLYIFKHDKPPAGIILTVSIRDSLVGSDLTVTSANADQIENYKWVSFDFPDIDVTPENTYYIVCRSDGGEGDNVYCWFYENDNPYTRGDGWFSNDAGLTWRKPSGTQTNEADFCFKTWYTESKNKPCMNTPFLRFLEQNPRLFPFLRQLLGL
jgi:hypothetical protein